MLDDGEDALPCTRLEDFVGARAEAQECREKEGQKRLEICSYGRDEGSE